MRLCFVEGRKVRHPEGGTEDGPSDDDRSVVGLQGIESLLEKVPSAGGEGQAAPGPGFLGQHSADLHHQERVARREADDVFGHGRPHRDVGLLAEQGGHGLAVEAPQLEAVGAPTEAGERRPGSGVGVAVGADDQDGEARQVTGDGVEKADRALVGPVEVVEDEQGRTFEGGLLDGGDHGGVGGGAGRRSR